MLAHDVSAAHPRRFMEAPRRNRRLGRPLRILTKTVRPDQQLIDRIGQRLMHRDEVGAELVAAMHITDAANPDRVTMGQFHQALDSGVHTVADCPRPLRDFFAAVERVPAWVDFDLVNEGAAAYRRLGTNAADVMLQLSLIGGYRFGGPTDLLVETGGLTGRKTVRRLAETQKWAVAVSQPDAMRRSGEGFKLTVHVRAMHALVNHQFETNGRWDVAHWGLPINQTDQAATLGLFNGALLLGVRLLGVRVSGAESRAIMHLWKYVGWLLGVDEDWLCDNEAAQHRLNYHMLITQSGVSEAGPPLANAIVDAQRLLHYPNLAGLRGAYHRARLLSMLSYFLRSEGMGDLELPRALPWAVAPVIAKNVVRYQLLSRTRAGRDHLERWGVRSSERLLAKYFGEQQHGVGELAA
ncbi:oxygenase MpaB family protein [Mycolicibacterium arseniciresistens]|uniref:Oxygenase MpaB family protein n=1 Tax=Mycolicibacterium arseniciresistens TaxID=3062257 RepID=A0ABT8UR65_9MYCO|nr:oxygenase MpaB family protein [Mycolicibacterium arseniciresistens]MDO3639641.1 oxygenase MpaB family protein [Mycolicibacterium arseniciresistens]